MVQTPEGAKKARATMVAKYGGEEEYKAEMRRRLSKAGKNSTSRPFRDKPGLASRAGKVGKSDNRTNLQKLP